MDSHPRQLPVPPPAAADPRAIEMLRVWASNGLQHVSINPGLWSDPANWGMMLVDLAKHIANAYEQSDQMSRAVALDRIKCGFDAEWAVETDDVSGELAKGKLGSE